MVADPSVVERYECYCCPLKEVSDQHHIIPVEYDGPKTGRTVPLCPSCHRHVHREAEHQFKTKTAGKHINTINYPKAEYRKRAETLANYVLQAKIRFLQSGKEKADGARNMVQLSLTNDELRQVHILKKDLGFTSLPKLLKYLIQEKLASKL